MAARSFDSVDEGIQRVHQLPGPPARREPPLRHSLRPRLAAITPCIAEAVRYAGGWLFDQAMIGWDVSVLTTDDADARPLQILGVRTVALETVLSRPVRASCLQAIAVHADLYGTDPRVRRFVREAVDAGQTDVRLWGEPPSAALAPASAPLRHQLSVAARAFKAQALAAAAVPACPCDIIEVFRRDAPARPRLTPAR